MREHEAVNSGCAKVRSLQYLQTWQMIILIFLSRFLYLQHQRFKRKRRKFKLLPNSEKKSRALFEKVLFVASSKMLSTAATI